MWCLIPAFSFSPCSCRDLDSVTTHFCFGRDRLAVSLTSAYTFNVYHHKSCEFDSRPCRGVLDETVCVKKSLKILKGYSEAINQKTDKNNDKKKKDKNIDPQITAQKRLSNTNPTKNKVNLKGK